MNIFMGSNRPLDKDLLAKSSKIISALSGDFTRFDHDQISIWKESLDKNVVEYYLDENYEIVFDGYLNNIDSPINKFLPILCNRIINGKPILNNIETGIFNIAIIDRKSNNIYLASDPSALYPLYYIHAGEMFSFFSHMYIISEALNLKPDLVGIIEKISFNYTIGSRTLYDSLMRLNPGEVIVFNQASRKIQIQQSEVYFTNYEDYGKNLNEVTWSALNQPFKALASESKTLGVMLSEGFDSRLMAGIADKNGFSVSAFTHGSPGTFGCKITFDVAQQIGADYHFDPLSEGLPSEEEKIRTQLFLSDNLSIPYWINGNEYFSKKNVHGVLTGYALDSTLGGNIFFHSKNRRLAAITQRYSEIIMQDLNNLSAEYIEKLSSELIIEIRSPFTNESIINFISYYFSSEVTTRLKKVVDFVRDDLLQEFDRIKNTGSCLESQLLQRFVLEQTDRKSFFGQMQTIRQKNNCQVPSYEPLTMRIVSMIHPKFRLHHKLYKQLMDQYLPIFTTIPNGGYGTAANKPRLLLETSRFIHKVEEARIIRQYLIQEGKRDISKLRTANFIESTYRKGNTLNYFEQFFTVNKRFFNHENLTKKINRIRNYESKSYQVMDYFRMVEILTPLSHL